MNKVIVMLLVLLVIGCSEKIDTDVKTTATTEDTKTEKAVGPVTQEDLDKLKSNIESIEAEDLEALTDE